MMKESRISFEHFACLASSADTEEQYEINAPTYASHEPLTDIDKGYELYELNNLNKAQH